MERILQLDSWKSRLNCGEARWSWEPDFWIETLHSWEIGGNGKSYEEEPLSSPLSLASQLPHLASNKLEAHPFLVSPFLQTVLEVTTSKPCNLGFLSVQAGNQMPLTVATTPTPPPSSTPLTKFLCNAGKP